INANDVIKVASNENPRGCSPKVIQAVCSEAKNMSLYPDDSMYELKDMLSKKYGVTSKNVIIGSGSDQVIEFILHAKADKNSKILTAGVTFAMYEIYSKHVGANVIKTDLAQHNLNEFLEIYKKNRDIEVIFLCVPNNPLGECLDRDDIHNFLNEIDKNTLVVIDGAYQEFASFKDKRKYLNPKELIETFENTIYLGTFSKAYGLGGMRVGYGIANADIINSLSKLRPPFNITTLSLKAAIVALQDEEFMEESVKLNFKEMIKYENLAKELKIERIPSYTNFITYLLPNDKNSSKISQELLRKGIIIRDLSSYKMNAIRITIGTDKQNEKIIEMFKNIYINSID
ncbi:MAG: histidinol-phosphate transaminase, partial [Campylobacteraceae bacterium]|nr:histidinol-phosphate transaminase [Campylobacteraceae bacterium]